MRELTARDIDAITCQTIKENVAHLKNMLHAVRRHFKEQYPKEWNLDMSDEDLFAFGLQKYKEVKKKTSEIAAAAADDFWRWTYRRDPPYYLCSYYRSALLTAPR